MFVVFILRGIQTAAESLMQRELKFQLFVNIEVISYVAYGVIGVVFALLGAGYWALASAYISQNLLKAILLVIFERHSKKPQFHWESFKELFFFGRGFTIGSLSNQFALQADELVVGRWLGSGALGLYGRAYQMMIMPANLLGQVMDKVLFPAMARIQNKQERLTASFRIGLTAISFITIPVSVLIIFLAKDIVILLFGHKWLNLV